MALIAKPQRGIFIGLFSAFTLFGTSMTIVGAALPKILGDFKWSYSAAGAVIAASAAAFFLSSLFSGKALKRIGPKATLLSGLAACVTGLAFFAASPSFLANLLLNALIGAGQGFIEPTVNWCTMRMDERGTGRPMNLMHGAFAIGAVAGPVVLGVAVGAGLSWTLLFRAIAGFFALLALALAAMPFSRLGRPDGREEAAPSPAAGGESGARARRPASIAFFLGFVCLFLYVGAEMGISNWIAEYFVRIFGAGPAFASLCVSMFWIGLLAGRFGVPALYRGDRPEVVLVASSLLLVASMAALCAIGFASSGAPGAASPLLFPFALTFLAGLGCSIVYPTVISLVAAVCRGSQAEAISLSVSGGGVGLFAFPFLMSWISQAFGIKTGFASYAIIAALSAASCAVLAGVYSRSRRDLGSRRGR
jgi:fucose permease